MEIYSRYWKFRLSEIIGYFENTMKSNKDHEFAEWKNPE